MIIRKQLIRPEKKSKEQYEQERDKGINQLIINTEEEEEEKQQPRRNTWNANAS